MSKKISTKEVIIEKALELYNTHGVEYVGVRELAKELNMKGGNINYYFPTKNDLLIELSERLSEGNTVLFKQDREVSIYNFLDMHRNIYANQYKYRSLFISLPLWVKHDSTLAENYKGRQQQRRKSIYDELKSLFLSGYFQTAKAQDLDAILNAITTTNRFWISEATLDEIIDDKELAINTYLLRLAGLLHIISSEKGKADIRKFLRELDI